MNILQRIKNWFTGKEPEKTIDDEVDELIAHVENPRHREIYKTVIKNQIRYCSSVKDTSREKCPSCGESLPNEGIEHALPKIAVKILDEIIVLDDIIGIQPMSGPVGLVYKLRCQEDSDEHLSLQVVSSAIEARTRKLTSAWTVEATQDLKTTHGVDIEEEILKALATQIAHEIISEVLAHIKEDVTVSQTYIDLLKPETVAAWKIDVNKQCNNIASDTHRGTGNFMIVSSVALSLLQADPSNKFVPTQNKPTNFRLNFAGMLDSTIKVYVDVFSSDDAILGYKGANGEIDAGYFYAPYIMIMSSGIIVDPTTFEPKCGLMTRYGSYRDVATPNYYKVFHMKSEAERQL